MKNKNNFFPVTRLRPDYTLVSQPFNKGHRYEIYNHNVEPVTLSIIVDCDGNDKVINVAKGGGFKETDKRLYTSLRRFDGKIYWDRHFKYAN